MVDKWGNLRPFRITAKDFVDLAVQLDDLLPKVKEGTSRFHIRLDTTSDYCKDMDDLNKLLMAVSSKVVREFALTVWGLVSPKAEPQDFRYLSVSVSGSSDDAHYAVRNATSLKEANGVADRLIGFRGRHAASIFLDPFVGSLLVIALLFVAFVAGVIAWSCLFQSCGGLFPASLWQTFRPVDILCVVCSVAVAAYIVWSYFTKDPPSLSFRHSILYMDKEPKNSVLWGVLWAMIVGVLSGGLVILLLR